ncbi:MAG: hypothetical protein AABZ74_00375 [Cyanobacteriota bacterium]
MNNKFEWNNFKDIALNIKAQDFFETDTSSSGLIEAWKRSFVSRLYYSCFHNCVEIAEKVTLYKNL